MVRLFGAACGADIEALRAQIPAQWLSAWNVCHKIGKNEKAARLSLSALSLLHCAGAVGTLTYGDNGRPYFEEHPCDFSITHTQNHVFCAILDGEHEPMRVGIDAEDLNRPDFSNLQELATRWFVGEEQKTFLASPTKETFLRIWTRKEAYVKRMGTGLRDLSALDTASVTDCRFAEYRLEDTCITLVCAPNECPPEEICMVE